MNCPKCGGANREGAQFCRYCGDTFARTCLGCRAELEPDSRFCDACGRPVGGEAAQQPAAIRKTVTIVFADLTGSTPMQERLDPESVRSLMTPFYVAMRNEVESHGGEIAKFAGDGVMAVFGLRETREDDALRALEASLSMIRALDRQSEAVAAQHGAALTLKVGVNTGEIVVGAGDEDLVGDALNVASRLEGAAAPGEVLVGEETWRLTRSVATYEAIAPLTLKGKSQPVPAYRLLSVDRASVESGTSTFVGRDEELARLLTAFEEAVAHQSARLVTVVGSPGLGKTRLGRELANALRNRASVLDARCDAAGTATFAPIADALRTAAGIDELADAETAVAAIATLIPSNDTDRDRIATRAAAVVGAGAPGSTEETFWAVRRVLESMARERPVVLVVDDLHWAEPMLLDLVEHLAEWIREAPVLLVAMGRPELREMRPAFVEDGRAAAVIALEGLDETATQELACGLLATDECPWELVSRLPTSTEGNPLFVGELVRMLVDDGVLQREDGKWAVTVNLDAIEVPPTIQSLLAARVDRLRAEERTVLELASVVGKEFYRGVLSELAPPAVRNALDTHLESLRRKELVEPAGTYWIDEPVYRFHHVLIRDAAYRRLLKRSRAELHERVADWLGEKTGTALGEHEELVGYHLEQAHESRRQLGPVDDHGSELGRRAAALLGSAARRALDLDDLPAAAALSGRALDRLEPDDTDRAELLVVRCEALLSMGDVTAGGPAVHELERLSTGSPRLTAWSASFVGQLANLTDPTNLHETEQRVAAAAAELTNLGDAAGAAKAHTVHASALALLGQVAACEAALDSALTAAREAEDRRRVTAVLAGAPVAALWGPSPVSRAGGRCLDIVRLLRITTGSPAVEATSMRCQAVLEAFRGRADAARRMLRSSRRTLEELGLAHGLLETDLFTGIVELVAGNPSGAEPHLRSAHEGFRAMGVDVDAARAAAFLARAHLACGEEDEADRFAIESERLAGEDLKAAIAWRAVRAEILARRGQFAEARRLAEAAVALAGGTDALVDHGDACLALAAVLRAAGDDERARAAAGQAAALYERKGATALVEQAQGAGAPVQRTVDDGVPAARKASTILENRATGWAREFDELFERRDWDAIGLLSADQSVINDRRPLFVQLVEGRDAWIELMRGVAELGAAVRIERTTIAVRGELLALDRTVWQGPDVGAFRFGGEALFLIEIDVDGRLVRSSVFEPEYIDAAMAELDERYLAGEGAAYSGSWKPELMRAANARDWDAVRDMVDDRFVLIDHRPVSLGRMEGPDEFIRWLRTMAEVASDFRWTPTSIVHIADNRCLFTLAAGGSTPDGAGGDISALILYGVRGGRVTYEEIFPDEQRDAAFARFDEQGQAPRRTVGAPENRCTRAALRFIDRFEQRDWAAVTASLDPDAVFEDRRPGLGVRSDGRQAVLEMLEALASVGVASIEVATLATHGERLALGRAIFSGPRGDPRSFEAECLVLHELNTNDQLKSTVLFDAQDFRAALSDLDERYLAGEGALHADVWRPVVGHIEALNARDWDRFRSCFSADVAIIDHRPASLGPADLDQFVRFVQSVYDVAPDMYRWVVQVEAIDTDRMLCASLGRGTTPERAEVELAFYLVSRVRGGRIVRLEIFPVDRHEQARACFEELGASEVDMPGGLENDCTRSDDRFRRALVARDLAGVTDCLAEDVTLEDRRSGVGWSFEGRGEVIAHFRELVPGLKELIHTYLAIRGNRLALIRERFELVHGFVAENLIVEEIDSLGRLVRGTAFDPNDLDAAIDELERRYAAGEGAPYAEVVNIGRAFVSAYNRRDWDAMRTAFASRLTVVDHRPASLGRIEGVDAWLDATRSLVSLAPDMRVMIVEYRTLETDRAVFRLNFTGTFNEGGPIEVALDIVASAASGVVTHVEYYPVEMADAALARFHELGLEPSENAQTKTPCERVSFEFYKAFNARDLDSLSALNAEEVEFVDRRAGLMSVVKGRDAQLDQVRVIVELGIYQRPNVLLANRGRRLALYTVPWTNRDENAPLEIETLMIVEIDAAEHISRVVIFDPDDLDAAMAELDDRYIAGEGAPAADHIRLMGRFASSYNARDWNGLRRVMSADTVMLDHRPAGWGEVEGAEATIRHFLTLIDLAPDVRLDLVSFPALSEHGFVVETRAHGLDRHGGGFEISTHTLMEVRDGVIVRAERFPLERLDDALARFEELKQSSPAAAKLLENACIRSVRRLVDSSKRHDWDAVSALLHPEVIRDDRRRGLGSTVVGADGPGGFVDAARQVGDVGLLEVATTPLATRGERLALFARSFADTNDFEIELLALYEVDDIGRIVAAIYFDPDDLSAAFVELDERYLSGEAACAAEMFVLNGCAVPSLYNARDWTKYAGMFSEDVAFIDHRPVSAGELHGRDQFIEYLRGLVELMPDARLEVRAVYRLAAWLAVIEYVVRGSTGEGGAAEVLPVAVVEARDGHIVRVETFPSERRADAIARFEELSLSSEQPA